MLTSITHTGPFLYDTGIAGETRADGAWPSMVDVMPLSRDRWLVVFATRGFLGIADGFRGNDNDRSILYQLRCDVPTGPVIKEGCFKRYRNDWDPLDNGGCHLMQHCPTGGFGVPHRALLGGRRVPHENVFVVTWYCEPRACGTGPDHLPSPELEDALYRSAFHIEWTQFRLASDGNDIEILLPPQPLRQCGYEQGEVFCDMIPPSPMNKWYVRPAPANDDMSEWVQVPHFRHGLAAIRFAFNAAKGLYEWVQTSPLLANPLCKSSSPDRFLYMETSTLRYGDSWIVAARTHNLDEKTRGIAWFRTDDIFKPLPPPVFPGVPVSKSQASVFRCADGILRLFTSDAVLSPYRNDRNPLYAWDINPDAGFQAGQPTTLFDAETANLRVRPETQMRVDAANLIAHSGGAQQAITCRVRLRRRTAPHTQLVPAERERTAVYHQYLHYDRESPADWQWA